MAQDHDIGLQIVEAVAEQEGTDPLEVTPPLHDVVDAEALEALVRSGEGIAVSFVYAGYVVHVDGPDSVRARPQPNTYCGEHGTATDGGSAGRHSEFNQFA